MRDLPEKLTCGKFLHYGELFSGIANSNDRLIRLEMKFWRLPKKLCQIPINKINKNNTNAFLLVGVGGRGGGGHFFPK